MNILVLARGSYTPIGTRSVLLPLLYPSLHLQQTRAASLDSAIRRGIRRSQNAGLGRSGRSERSARDVVATSGASALRLRRGKKDITEEDEEEKPKRRSRAARYYDPDSRFGRRSLEHRKKLDAEKEAKARAERGAERDAARSRLRARETVQSSFGSRRAFESDDKPQRSSQFFDRNRRGSALDERQPRSQETSTSRRSHTSAPPDTTIRKSSPRKTDPISIPYTTPASEFLYGTSVVEAALRSQRVPRRKLYKLYIYTGENREDVGRDASSEKQARRIGLQVIHIDSPTGLRMLDKMSTGRPHNGYVLEASPLPKLPIANLGEVLHESSAFRVVLEQQSREEAAVNGTTDLIPLPRTSRKPFILFLDGILDPGNLGGIIRTAAFLGVTAIAISVRHTAAITPVVLKASAGAIENVPLFSVNKPASFITDSKKAGWKVYAAVAPSGSYNSVSTNDLHDPLGEDPCILMLGNEGDGLRTNLRSKADVEVSVEGVGRSHGVDSLNVSVAAGILCHAFLLRRSTGVRKPAAPAPETCTGHNQEDLF